jgi:hypothetical protein
VKKSKNVEKICNNCLLYNRSNSTCKVAVLLDGEEHHIPVDPKDKCHIEELGIEIKQVRWWVEDDKGNPVDGDGIVKIEYPVDFFGPEKPQVNQ